ARVDQQIAFGVLDQHGRHREVALVEKRASAVRKAGAAMRDAGRKLEDRHAIGRRRRRQFGIERSRRGKRRRQQRDLEQNERQRKDRGEQEKFSQRTPSISALQDALGGFD